MKPWPVLVGGRLEIVTELLACIALFACAACTSGTAAVESSDARVSEAWQRVAELEDARTTNAGELAQMLASDDADLRARLATALGRMPFPDQGAEVTRALLEALFDADAGVRVAAAFALGVRGDPSAADKLLFVARDHHEADRDGLVRARALEAASKLDRPELRERVLDGLLDSDSRVRLEAAQGASRWPVSEVNASAVNQRLVDSLANETDSDVIVYTLFSLERRKAQEAIDEFLRYAQRDDLDQRLFAVRGLRALAPELRALGALMSSATASEASDWRVRSEAIGGLAAYDDPEAFATMYPAITDPNPHLARVAWESIGAQLERAGHMPRELIEPARGSPSVRAAQLEALARAIAKRLEGIAPPELGKPLDYPARANLKDTLLRDAYTLLQRAAVDQNALVRAGAARAAARLPADHALRFLERLAHDSSALVAGSALEGLAKNSSAESRKLLHDFLAHPDNGVRLAAVTALADMPDLSDVEPLQRAFETSTGDGAVEVRFNVLRSAGKILGGESGSLLGRGLFDPHPFVRRVAREEFSKRKLIGTEIAKSLAYRSEDEFARASRPLEVANLGSNPVGSNPMVEIVTSRGSMTFELVPLEAPFHVHNFLALALLDHYDGLTFHRVVPDFVIQGGDYRGDGNGGGTWRGRDDSLRHEISPRKYVRGSLGMPRNDDVDSGGSQFFVTHRPTPHLDGRYTIFGELRSGLDVLDAIEVGDGIVDVRVLR